jgi:phospholipase/lecithinase/hemolysin
MLHLNEARDSRDTPHHRASTP